MQETAIEAPIERSNFGKARIIAAWWAFKGVEAVERCIWRLTFRRVDIFRTKGRTNKVWDFWIWLASYAWNIDEL